MLYPDACRSSFSGELVLIYVCHCFVISCMSNCFIHLTISSNDGFVTSGSGAVPVLSSDPCCVISTSIGSRGWRPYKRKKWEFPEMYTVVYFILHSETYAYLKKI